MTDDTFDSSARFYGMTPRGDEDDREGRTERMDAPPPVDAMDAAYGMEARVMLKSVRLPEEGPIDAAMKREIIDTAREHLKRHKIALTTLAHQVGISESALSEALRGQYKADDTDILRRVNAWLDDDERRRRRSAPIGLYETRVLLSIRDAAAIAKKNARTSHDRSVHGGGERIVIAVGPSGIGKSAAAEAVAASDPNALLIRLKEHGKSGTAILDMIIETAGWRATGTRESKGKYVFERLKHSGRLLIVDEFHRASESAYNMIRDLAEVCGVPILLLGTSRLQRRVDGPRSGVGKILDEQFSRRVAYVVDLLKGSDGHGGDRRPFFSIDEIVAIFKSDKLKLSQDGAEFLAAIACCVGIGMLGQAANIYEKAAYAARRHGKGIIDAALLRAASEKVLMPIGARNPDIMRQIDAQLDGNRRMLRQAAG